MKRVLLVLLGILFLAGCSEQQVSLPQTQMTTDASQTEETKMQVQTEKEGPISYTVEKSIHESLPAFNFTLHGEYICNAELYPNERYQMYEIIIKNADGYEQQMEVTTAIPAFGQETYGFAFDDWNFDGYMDISLWQYPGGSLGNKPSYYWLWDKNSNCYMENADLRELSQSGKLSIDMENNQICVFSASGNLGWYETFYSYDAGNFVKKRTLHYTSADDVAVTYYE